MIDVKIFSTNPYYIKAIGALRLATICHPPAPPTHLPCHLPGVGTCHWRAGTYLPPTLRVDEEALALDTHRGDREHNAEARQMALEIYGSVSRMSCTHRHMS